MDDQALHQKIQTSNQRICHQWQSEALSADLCGATDKIVEQYGLRHIRNIEGSGTEADRQAVKGFLEQLQTDESFHKNHQVLS